MAAASPPTVTPARGADAGPPDPEAVRRTAALLGRVADRSVRVGMIGLGYVGLPLARAFAARGIAALGFDVDTAKVRRLQRGESYIGHIGDATVAEMRRRGFEATDRFERLDEPD